MRSMKLQVATESGGFERIDAVSASEGHLDGPDIAHPYLYGIPLQDPLLEGNLVESDDQHGPQSLEEHVAKDGEDEQDEKSP